MNLQTRRNLPKRKLSLFLQILWEWQYWKEVLVLQAAIYILCTIIQLVINQERQLCLNSSSLWIVYHVIFTFFSVLGAEVSKKKKKIYYMLQNLSASKLFKAKVGVNEEICSVLD